MQLTTEHLQNISKLQRLTNVQDFVHYDIVCPVSIYRGGNAFWASANSLTPDRFEKNIQKLALNTCI